MKIKNLFRRIFAIMISSIFACGAVPGMAMAEETDDICIYVSPSGDDSGDGTISKPFKTPERARDYVRSIRSAADGDINVFFRGGTYNIEKPVEFNGSDKGANSVYYRAYSGETPVFTAGKEISGWEHHTGNVFKVFVGNDLDMLQLFIDDERQTLARWPNEDAGDGGKIRLPNPGEGRIPVEKGTFDYISNVQGMRVVSGQTWRQYIYTAVSLKKGNDYDFVEISQDQVDNTWVFGSEIRGCEAYFENKYEFMDSPGEWFKDKDGYLYYYADDDTTAEKLNAKKTIIPIGENIIKFTGNIENPAENIVFDGISFKHTAWTWTLYNSLITNQANLFFDIKQPASSTYRLGRQKKRVPAAIEGQGIKNLTIRNCKFSQLGTTAIYFSRYVDTLNIIGNKFKDCSGAGIEIGDDYYKAETNWFPKNININNNFITKCNVQWNSGCGITVLYASDTRIEHNYLYDLAYTGINVGWGWDTFVPEMNKNWTVRYNRIENCMNTLHDGGYFYSPNPAFGYNVFEGNYIKADKTQIDPGLNIAGIYHDANPENWNDINNVVEGLQLVLFTGAKQHNVKGLWSNFDASSRYKSFPSTFVMESMIQTDEPFWEDDAQRIIDNAGLQKPYLHLLDEASPIEVDTEALFYNANIGQVKQFNVCVTNNTNEEKEAEIVFSDGKEKHFDMPNYSQKVMVPAKSKVMVPFQIRFDTLAFAAPNFVDAYAVIDGEKHDFQLAIIVNKVGNEVISVTDKGYVETKGTWHNSGIGGHNGISRYAGNGMAEFRLNVSAGKYKVAFYNAVHEVNEKNLLIKVFARDETHEIHLDQTAGESGWVELGEFNFAAGEAVVECSGPGCVRTSAVSFEALEAAELESFGGASIGMELDIGEYVAVSIDGDVLKDGKDYFKLDVADIDGNMYVSARDFANYFDSRIERLDGENKLGIIKGATYIEADAHSNTVMISGENYELSHCVRIKDNRMFLEIGDAAGMFGMRAAKSNDGRLCILTKTELTGDNESLFDVLRSMLEKREVK